LLHYLLLSRLRAPSPLARCPSRPPFRPARVVAAAVDDDVRVHVPGDRGHEPDPVAGVLEHARLLDVHLDPAAEVVEHPAALAPPDRKSTRLNSSHRTNSYAAVCAQLKKQ